MACLTVDSLLLRLDGLDKMVQSLPVATKADFLPKQIAIILIDLKGMSFTFAEATSLVNKVNSMGCLGQDVLDALIGAIMDRVVNANLVPKKQTQDYSNLVHYLTEAIWNVLVDDQHSLNTKLHALMMHLLQLGLRNPSEQTYAWICALLHLNIEQDEPHVRYEKLSIVKPLVKRYCEASTFQASVEKLPSDPQEFLVRVPMPDTQFAKCPLCFTSLSKACKSIPLRCTNRQSKQLMSDMQLFSTASSSSQHGALPYGGVDLTTLLHGVFQMANRQSLQKDATRIEILGTSQPSPLEKQVATSRALLNLPVQNLDSQSSTQTSTGVPTQQQHMLEDKKPETSAEDLELGEKLESKDPLAVIAALQARGPIKRPASSKKSAEKPQAKKKPAAAAQVVKAKPVAKAKFVAKAKPLPTKTEALKLKPSGCGRCRHTPGCYPGCWLRRSPYMQ